MELSWENLDETDSFSQLKRIDEQIDLARELSRDRALSWKIDSGAGVSFYYGASLLSSSHIDALGKLAEEQELLGKYRALLDGEVINTGERRRVLHHLTRGQLGKDVVEDGINLREFYKEQNARVREFSEGIHSGQIVGSTGRHFDTIVQIGIGGSDLGPRALYLALEGIHRPKMRVHFISNVDPDDAMSVCSRVNPESTLFILVSKSGTTPETLANRDLIIDWMRSARIRGLNPKRHFIVITGKASSLVNSMLASFHIDDSIGGRYSSTSVVGGAILSLAFGPDVFDELLAGAHEMDKRCLAEDVRDNAALLDALIGVYYRNVLGFQTSAVLPYSQALRRFPAHLQQLDMESNGKSVNRFGDRIFYPTGPVIFGEPGTNGQHSFYQLLHQGTDVVPLQFIGFIREQSGRTAGTKSLISQRQLNANLAAQIVAFARGRRDKDSNKTFEGCRPSTLLVAQRLDARALGGLLAYYENKVMFQGFCWNINSFDQEGVQLGKTLTTDLLGGNTDDAALGAYSEILGIK